MATFVLVHGHYIGAWAWDDVARRLRADGHDVFVVKLEGMGERADEATSETGLSHHVADVVRVLATHDLHDVVLVGHSYGGMIIEGVAARAGDRIGSLVFLDAVVARHGQRLLDFYPGNAETIIVSAGSRGLVPPVDAHAAGLEGDDADRANARFTGVPLGTFTQALDAPGDPAFTMPRTYIACLRCQIMAPTAQRLRADPGWTFREIDSGHLPMISHPGDVSRVLEELLHH
jgi:pimeloyl-ACP methyl ester carboxylesterase